MNRPKSRLGLSLIIGLLLATLSSGAAAKEWYPLAVDVWEPPFNGERQRVTKEYRPLARAERRWRLCVLIPHLKDAYWLAVNFGLVDEARRLGVDLAIYEAGGYARLEVQREQFKGCLKRDAQGVILGAISADGLNDLIAEAAGRGVPVVDMINGADSPDLAARAAVDFYDTGFQVGAYLKGRAATDGEALQIAWFPGPEGAGWVAAGDRGLRAALADAPVEIVATRHGDTGKRVQAGLIEAVLEELGEAGVAGLDYIVGTAVSAEAAVSLLRRRGLHERIGVLAYYYGPGVHKGIKRGSILAAPSDAPAIQARMAVDTLTRILEGREHFKHAAPKVRVIDRGALRDREGGWDRTTTLAPRGFRPIFSVSE